MKRWIKILKLPCRSPAVFHLVSVLLLGAPQVAGAVFLFDKLIGDPLAKFTTVKYHLSGDWGDPSIVIDDGKATKPANKTVSVGYG